RASPVARRVLVTLLSLSPRRRSPPRRPACDGPCGLRPPVAGSASGASHFRGHLRVPWCSGLVARSPSPGGRGRWASGHSVSLRPAIPATGRLALAPVGLIPTERASLGWTHNRTCSFHRIRLSSAWIVSRSGAYEHNTHPPSLPFQSTCRPSPC